MNYRKDGLPSIVAHYFQIMFYTLDCSATEGFGQALVLLYYQGDRYRIKSEFLKIITDHTETF